MGSRNRKTFQFWSSSPGLRLGSDQNCDDDEDDVGGNGDDEDGDDDDGGGDGDDEDGDDGDIRRVALVPVSNLITIVMMMMLIMIAPMYVEHCNQQSFSQASLGITSPTQTGSCQRIV